MLKARAESEYREDISPEVQESFKTRIGSSYLDSDFKRQVLNVEARIVLDSDQLPPALQPLDAELSGVVSCQSRSSLGESAW